MRWSRRNSGGATNLNPKLPRLHRNLNRKLKFKLNLNLKPSNLKRDKPKLNSRVSLDRKVSNNRNRANVSLKRNRRLNSNRVSPNLQIKRQRSERNLNPPSKPISRSRKFKRNLKRNSRNLSHSRKHKLNRDNLNLNRRLKLNSNSRKLNSHSLGATHGGKNLVRRKIVRSGKTIALLKKNQTLGKNAATVNPKIAANVSARTAIKIVNATATSAVPPMPKKRLKLKRLNRATNSARVLLARKIVPRRNPCTKPKLFVLRISKSAKALSSKTWQAR